MPEKMCKKKHLTSFQLIILGFAGVILLGSILLMLPVSSLEKMPTPFHEAGGEWTARRAVQCGTAAAAALWGAGSHRLYQ